MKNADDRRIHTQENGQSDFRVRIGNINEIRNTLSKEEIKKAEQEYKSVRGKKSCRLCQTKPT